jgi:hypothetical protein
VLRDTEHRLGAHLFLYQCFPECIRSLRESGAISLMTICSGAILILTVRKSKAEAEKLEIFVSGSPAQLVSVAAERCEDLLPRNKKSVERLGLTPGEWADFCEDKEAMERAVAILTGGAASVRASSAPLPPPPVSPAPAIAGDMTLCRPTQGSPAGAIVR